jgi:hypothetical protein
MPHQNALVLVPFRELLGYLYRSSGVVCNKSVNGLISLCFITGLSIFYPDVNKISIELLKALETLASTVTTLQECSIKATLFTDAVTTILLECLRAAILAARSIRANNSPPKDYSKDLFR